MNNSLFIPKIIHVGFQSRDDTYTKKLGYVIYEDEKGKLRKEVSWRNWINSAIPVQSFENIPSRFVLNKEVKRYGHWGYSGTPSSKVRIFDTRDFEFEISVDNLIGILMHSDVSKRDIQEECVYAWAGQELVLLPVNSDEYVKSIEFTKKQDLKVSAKELKKGHVYGHKKENGTYVYMGYDLFHTLDWKKYQSVGKKHIFYGITSKRFESVPVGSLSQVVSEDIYPEFADLAIKLENTGLTENPIDVVACKKDKQGNPLNGNSYYKKLGDKLYFVSLGSGLHAPCDITMDNFITSIGEVVHEINDKGTCSFTYEYLKFKYRSNKCSREEFIKGIEDVMSYLNLQKTVDFEAAIGYVVNGYSMYRSKPFNTVITRKELESLLMSDGWQSGVGIKTTGGKIHHILNY